MEFQRTFEILSGGFVTPTVIGDAKISGCVYRADGSKVVLSERFGGCKGDFFRSDNPDLVKYPDCPKRLGKGLYLGSLMCGHYGHFITEGLCTFWIFEEIPVGEFDYFLFNPFVFGIKIPSYALKCFEIFGIDPAKVVIMGDESLAFEELVVPERLLRLNHSAAPCLRRVYQKIQSGANSSVAPAERIYLSRRKVSRRQLTRVIANELWVEKLFIQAGFTVIYPEGVPFQEQVALYANAKLIAGPSGSSLHNSLFMKAGAKLIELGDPRYGGNRAPTQMLCDLISGVENYFIPFVGTIRGDGHSVSFSIGKLRTQLIRALKNAGVPTPAMEESLLRASLMERLESIYLSFRPLVGPALKRIRLQSEIILNRSKLR